MLKTSTVALLAIAMSAGSAQAKGHNCGTAANGRPLLCQKGPWCHYPVLRPCTAGLWLWNVQELGYWGATVNNRRLCFVPGSGV
jgi:hypothetical protein